MGSFIIPQNVQDDEISSDRHCIFEVEVGSEWVIVEKKVVKCTPFKLLGLAFNCCSITNSEFIFYVARKFYCLTDEVALLCALGKFQFEFCACIHNF